MRDEFVRTLSNIPKEDRNVIIVTGDLRFGVLTKFESEFPDQYLNAGVAEQNMTGLATGMALEGKIVFTYSIANFPTLRCLEQIRNDACYHNANVKIVSIGGGFSYGSLGISHHATEDLAIMRALPNITVFAPGDITETEAATYAAYKTPGTCYLRLGRGGEARVHGGKIAFKVGKAIKILQGNDIVLLSTGGILSNSFNAAVELKRLGYDIGLYSMHTLKPIDSEMIESVAKTARLIVTVEEHSIIGGLGGATSEVISQMQQRRAVLRMVGLRSGFSCIVGDQDFLRSMYDLSVESIIKTVKDFDADFK